MITSTEDPVQLWINRVHRLALTLMDECPTISVGMSNPNKIVTTPLYFEKLESEPSPRRRVAQQYRRSQERAHKRLVAGMMNLCASLYAGRHV